MNIKVGEKYKIGISENQGFFKGDKLVIKEATVTKIEREKGEFTNIIGYYGDDKYDFFNMYAFRFKEALKQGGEYEPEIQQFEEIEV